MLLILGNSLKFKYVAVKFEVSRWMPICNANFCTGLVDSTSLYSRPVSSFQTTRLGTSLVWTRRIPGSRRYGCWLRRQTSTATEVRQAENGFRRNYYRCTEVEISFAAFRAPVVVRTKSFEPRSIPRGYGCCWNVIRHEDCRLLKNVSPTLGGQTLGPPSDIGCKHETMVLVQFLSWHFIDVEYLLALFGSTDRIR